MSKILIFENPQDFLQVIEDLQREYNKSQEDKASNEAGNYE